MTMAANNTGTTPTPDVPAPHVTREEVSRAKRVVVKVSCSHVCVGWLVGVGGTARLARAAGPLTFLVQQRIPCG